MGSSGFVCPGDMCAEVPKTAWRGVGGGGGWVEAAVTEQTLETPA